MCQPIDGSVEQNGDVVEAQTELAVGKDAVQPFHRPRAITSVRRAPAPLLGLEQPDPVVVVKRPHRDSRKPSELSYRVDHRQLRGRP